MTFLYPHDRYIQPGDKYRISVAKLATFLAHSSHGIPQDPDFDPKFNCQRRRFLLRVGTHPIRSAFDLELCDETMRRCTSSTLRWDSVGLYRQGCPTETGAELDNPPTVLISVSDEPSERTIDLARGLACEVEELLRQRDFADVHVEIVSFPSAMDGAGEARPVLETTNDYEFAISRPLCFHPAFNGASIGPEGQRGSGTLSCYLSLRRGKQRRVCALTSHHVAALGQQDPLAPLSKANSVRLLSPSEMDRGAIFNKLGEEVAWTEDSIAQQEREKQEPERTGKVWPAYAETSLTDSKRGLEVLTTALASFQSSWEQHRVLGDVWLSSGLDTPQPGQNMKDWALVDVEPRRYHDLANIAGPDVLHSRRACEMVFSICDRLRIERPIREKYSFLRFFNPRHEQVVPAGEIQSMAASRQPTYVFLHGRSTTFSVGIVHDVRDGVCTRYLSDNGDKKEFTSREVVVLDVPSGDSHWDTHIPTVSEKGDSGAAIRLADGRILGFVFGSNREDESGRPATYVSIAETLLNHIKAVTGADQVEIPDICRGSSENSSGWVD